MKQLVSIILILALCLSLAPAVWAEDPADSQYCVNYDEADGAGVSVGGTTISSGAITSFTSGQAITFTLTPPTGGTVYRVDIEVQKDPIVVYSTTDSERHLGLSGTGSVKNLEFTPEGDTPFQVLVWWSEAAYQFDTFGYKDANQFQVRTNIYGNGSVSFDKSVARDINGKDEIVTYGNQQKINFPSSALPLSVTITPTEGAILNRIAIGETEYAANPEGNQRNLSECGLTTAGGVYTITEGAIKELVGESSTYRYTDVYLELDFTGENGEGENPDQQKTKYDLAKDYIESWDFAYYGTTAGAIKTLMATELWNENFGDYNNHEGEYTGMFVSIDEFSDAIILSGSAVDTPFDAKNNNLLNLPYYEYSVVLTEGAIAAGNVYVLDNAKQFVVKDSAGVCTIVDTTNLTGENLDVYVRSSTEDTDFTVFGNGVCKVGLLEAATGDYSAYHITQEHSGLNTGISCRLAVLPKEFDGVNIACGVKAAAWGFAEIPVFSTCPDQDNPSVCEIYYGNDGSDGRLITVESVADDLASSTNLSAVTVSGIAVDTAKISADVATVTDNEDGSFSIKFNSNYDVIPMLVTYADSTTGYIEIHRVGLDINDGTVSEGQYTVHHGTDNDVKYDSSANKVVTASFYYNTGATAPAIENRVKLFVTIKTNSGTTRKLITHINDNCIETTGDDKYADDFLLWSGTSAEYDELISVSAIVYQEGSADSFGGVKVGSGTGVEWVNPGKDK